MPAKPRWWQHVTQIRAMREDAALPVIDRAGVERLFGLRRRQAIALMHRWGGYQAGRMFLIGRQELIRELDAIAQDGEYHQETARREQLASALEAARRTRQTEAVRIPVTPDVFAGRMDSLPGGVLLEPGRLAVAFAGPEDLLRKLFALVQAVANDYAGFESVATVRHGSPETRG